MSSIHRARTFRPLSKPSQLCGRWGFPADGQASPFGTLFVVDPTPHFLLYVAGCVSLAAPAALYALVFDANSQAGITATTRAKMSIGPIPIGGTFVYSEPVTEWWGLGGGDGGPLEDRAPVAGMPMDNGLVIAASTAPLVFTAPLGDFLSIHVRGAR